MPHITAVWLVNVFVNVFVRLPSLLEPEPLAALSLSFTPLIYNKTLRGSKAERKFKSIMRNPFSSI